MAITSLPKRHKTRGIQHGLVYKAKVKYWAPAANNLGLDKVYVCVSCESRIINSDISFNWMASVMETQEFFWGDWILQYYLDEFESDVSDRRLGMVPIPPSLWGFKE